MFTEFLREHDLRALLIEPKRRLPFPPATDRAAWETIVPRHLEQLLAEGESRHKETYQQLTASQFMAFCRTGDRRAYEVPYFQRRRKLMCTALAECALDDGRYLDDIINGLWLISEESFWGISAHNGSDHPGAHPRSERPLPDINNPYIDLFAAQTGALLSWICHLLQDKLDLVSPMIVRRIRREIQRRILDPFFFHDDFWWMGMIRQDVNNWTPWILSNIIAILLRFSDDDQYLADGLARCMRMLDAYIAVVPEDGGCDEGTAYWNMAGGSLLDCLELIDFATGGKVSFFDKPIIQAIGRFPKKAHIRDEYYWNFADCDAKPQLDGERVYRYGMRIGDDVLAQLGVNIESKNGRLYVTDTPEISRVLWRLFDPIDVGVLKRGVMPEKVATLPHLQIWAREREGIYFAIKAGHNGENHNHNDVGSFLLYLDGEPAIIDMGNMIYTAKTFSQERYELLNTRSRNHNVPLIGESEQSPGREFAAKNVQFKEDSIQMDIASAYPKKIGIRSLVRRVDWQDELLLTDDISLLEQTVITWVFMLREKPEWRDGSVCFSGLILRWDGELEVAVEEIPVTDERMIKNFPGSLWRLTLRAQPAKKHCMAFTIKRSNGHGK